MFSVVVVAFEVRDPCAGSELREVRVKKTPPSFISAMGTPQRIPLILVHSKEGILAVDLAGTNFDKRLADKEP